MWPTCNLSGPSGPPVQSVAQRLRTAAKLPQNARDSGICKSPNHVAIVTSSPPSSESRYSAVASGCPSPPRRVHRQTSSAIPQQAGSRKGGTAPPRRGVSAGRSPRFSGCGPHTGTISGTREHARMQVLGPPPTESKTLNRAPQVGLHKPSGWFRWVPERGPDRW